MCGPHLSGSCTAGPLAHYHCIAYIQLCTCIVQVSHVPSTKRPCILPAPEPSYTQVCPAMFLAVCLLLMLTQDLCSARPPFALALLQVAYLSCFQAPPIASTRSPPHSAPHPCLSYRLLAMCRSRSRSYSRSRSRSYSRSRSRSRCAATCVPRCIEQGHCQGSMFNDAVEAKPGLHLSSVVSWPAQWTNKL